MGFGHDGVWDVKPVFPASAITSYFEHMNLKGAVFCRLTIAEVKQEIELFRLLAGDVVFWESEVDK